MILNARTLGLIAGFVLAFWANLAAAAQGLEQAAGYALGGQYENARQIYDELAVLGEPEAMFHLAYMYEKGLGGEKNESEAYAWYYRSAERGFAPAQFVLGVFCENGQVAEPDPARAAHWYQKAAKQGYAYAQHNLAALYRDGRGIGQDNLLAAYWFAKAAKATHISDSERQICLEAAKQSEAKLTRAERLKFVELIGESEPRQAAAKNQP